MAGWPIGGDPVVLVARQSMVGTVFVNADGTARQANVYGVMVNL